MIKMYYCPLCEWSVEVPPLDERINEQTLAGVFGKGVFLYVALNDVAQKIEDAVGEHLKIHTELEWLAAVCRAQNIAAKLYIKGSDGLSEDEIAAVQSIIDKARKARKVSG